MKANNFKYYVSQAVRSVFRNGLMSVTSIFTVVCCMIILGLFMIISINVNHIAQQLEQQCEIQAFINEAYDDAQVSALQKQVKGIENIATAEIFSKEDTLEYMREISDNNAALLDGYEGEDNPFRDSLKITLKDLSLLKPTVEKLSAVEGKEEVSYKQTVMENILKVSNGIRNVSFWGMLLLCIVSIFIIANTIKLAVYARRKEIGVMKFVGATDWFIRWPFIIEGIIIGVVGALIAFGLISWGYIALVGKANIGIDIFTFKAYNEVAVQMIGMFVSIGAVIGALGSAISIRKHLDV
ncbi:MAG: permease-like cell division protein FtsX [Clostridia bacterium]|nr:permease-like cell division protein FtsX [Clostridia bacterium]